MIKFCVYCGNDGLDILPLKKTALCRCKKCKRLFRAITYEEEKRKPSRRKRKGEKQ